MTILAMTLPVGRRSPLYIPRRDLVLDVHDSLNLNLLIVASDNPDAAPLDLSGIGPAVRFIVWQAPSSWWDYGFRDYGWPIGRAVVSSVLGTISPSIPGSVSVAIPRNALACRGLRLGWSVQLDYAGDLSSIVWGALHLQPGAAGLLESDLDLLNDSFVPITDNGLEDILL